MDYLDYNVNVDDLKSAIRYAVVTPFDFAEYCLPLILVHLPIARVYVGRKKPKLSIFDGYSFDKMYTDLEKLLKKIGRRKDPALTSKDKDQILKILNKYKGKKSEYKLKKVSLLKGKIECDNIKSFSQLTEFIRIHLFPLYRTQDIDRNNDGNNKISALYDVLKAYWNDRSSNDIFIPVDWIEKYAREQINKYAYLIDKDMLGQIYGILDAVRENAKDLENITSRKLYPIGNIKWFYEIYYDRKENKKFTSEYKGDLEFISGLLKQVDGSWLESFEKSSNKSCQEARKQLENCVKRVKPLIASVL